MTGQGSPTDSVDPEGFLGYRLVRLAAALERRFKDDLAPTGLSPRQFSILAVLAHRPSITVADLARAVLTTPQSMAALVEALELRGFVVRSTPRRRGVAAPLTLTPAGRAAVARSAPRIAASESAVFGRLTRQQQAALDRILSALETHGDSATT